MDDTAWASLPLVASLIATTVPTPKKHHEGRPARNLDIKSVL